VELMAEAELRSSLSGSIISRGSSLVPIGR
jgi:hypothetical protein